MFRMWVGCGCCCVVIVVVVLVVLVVVLVVVVAFFVVVAAIDVPAHPRELADLHSPVLIFWSLRFPPNSWYRNLALNMWQPLTQMCGADLHVELVAF